MNTRAILAVAAIAALSIGLSANQGGAAAPAQRPSVMDAKGKAFPDFKLKTLDDKEFSNKSFKGKVTVIDFWATWCGPCVAAAPKLQAIHEDMKDKGVQIVGANAFERGGDGKLDNGPDKAKKYVEEHKYTYTFTYGGSELAQKLNITGIPSFFIIGKDGVVADVQVGFSEAKIRSAIEDALAK